MRRSTVGHALCAVQHFAGDAPQREKSWERGKVARCTIQGLVEPRSAPTSWKRLGVNRTSQFLSKMPCYHLSIKGCTFICHFSAVCHENVWFHGYLEWLCRARRFS